MPLTTMQNFAEIRQSDAELLSKMIFNMAAVRYLKFLYIFIFLSCDCHKFEICYCIPYFIKIG